MFPAFKYNLCHVNTCVYVFESVCVANAIIYTKQRAHTHILDCVALLQFETQRSKYIP